MAQHDKGLTDITIGKIGATEYKVGSRLIDAVLDVVEGGAKAQLGEPDFAKDRLDVLENLRVRVHQQNIDLIELLAALQGDSWTSH